MTRKAEHKVNETRTWGIEIEAYNVDRQVLAAALEEQGIACQVESYNHETRRDYWKIVSDGSIAGERSFEVVSPPLRGRDGLQQIHTVCAVLKACHALVNRSCGLHVHHDAGDLTLPQWKMLVKYYMKFEETIDMLMPPSRRGNINTYCRTLRHAATLTDSFAAVDQATTLLELAGIVCGQSRYYKVNLMAFWRHGTVEFRQHSGTIEYEKIAAWVELTQCLITRSVEHRVIRVTGRTDIDALLLRGWVTRGDCHSKPSTATSRFYTERYAAHMA